MNEDLFEPSRDELILESIISETPYDEVAGSRIEALLLELKAKFEDAGSGSWITSIPTMHRNIFRGQALGTEVTAAQLSAISDGSFDDLYVGDYWAINNVTYRVADMDKYLGTGDTPFTKHHLVIVPDEPLYNINANRINDLYINSTMRTTGLAGARTTINAAFPGMVLTYRNHFEGSDFTNADVELMSQILVLGSVVQPWTSGTPLPHRLDISQLALFALAPQFIRCSSAYWLRDNDARANTYFININAKGIISDDDGNTNQFGARPYFLIGAAE